VSELAALDAWTRRLLAIDSIDGRVLVGCSGGADSLALLALIRAAGLDAVAVYVDHGLRANTAHDLAVVRSASERLGVEAQCVDVSVAPGSNLEARARDARYEALEAARQDADAAAVLVGHTLDDQAETILLQFLRGSGSTGLAGMPVVRGRIRRPLLALRRAETREICARLGFAPVDDPMNADVRHRRVWLRREVIPFLEQGAQRDLVPVLVRQGEVLRDEDALLETLARDAVATDTSSIAASELQNLPRAVARRVVRQWLGSPPPGLADVEAVLSVVDGSRRAVTLPNERRVERTAGRLHLVTPTVSHEPVEFALPGGARFGPYRLDAWIESGAPVAWPDGSVAAVLDADTVGASVVVREPEPGERFRPVGGAGSKLVYDALAEAGVPASGRARRPVLSTGIGEVVWVVGYRVDERFRVTSRTRRYLWLTSEAE
jgi:tRNA(Ile)-lysidine synthase